MDIPTVQGIKTRLVIPQSISDKEYTISCELDHLVEIDGRRIGIELKTGNDNTFEMKRVLGYKKGPLTKDFSDYVVDPTVPCPVPKHLLQAAIYLYTFSGMEEYQDIQEWRLQYLSRGSMTMQEFRITLNKMGNMHFIQVELFDREERIWKTIPIIDLVVEQIFEKLITIGDMIYANVVPVNDFNPDLTEYDIDHYLKKGYISKTKGEKMKNGNVDNCDDMCNYCSWRQVCKRLPRQEIMLSEIPKYME